MTERSASTQRGFRVVLGFMQRTIATAPVIAAAVVVLMGLFSGADRASSQGDCAGPRFAADHIIVKMDEGAPDESVEIMRGVNGEGEERESPAPVAFWLVDVPAGKTATEALALYQTLADVAYAELDHLATPDATCPGSEASLEMAHAFNPYPVAVGEETAYAVVVLNHGPARASNSGVWVSVPDGAKVLSAGFSAGPRGGGCPTSPAGQMRCGFGELGAGEVATLKLVLRPTRPGPLSVTAEPFADNSAAVFEDTRTTAVGVPERCTVADTTGSGGLVGTPGPDVICGFDGDDNIRAMGGNDTVYGAGGNDTVYSGEGDDTSYGGPGDDLIGGGAGKDRVYGVWGADVLRVRDGVGGNDEAYGGPAKDTISADPGDRTGD